MAVQLKRKSTCKFVSYFDDLILIWFDSVGPINKGKVRIFYDVGPEMPIVAVVGLGPNNAAINELEELDALKQKGKEKRIKHRDEGTPRQLSH